MGCGGALTTHLIRRVDVRAPLHEEAEDTEMVVLGGQVDCRRPVLIAQISTGGSAHGGALDAAAEVLLLLLLLLL